MAAAQGQPSTLARVSTTKPRKKLAPPNYAAPARGASPPLARSLAGLFRYRLESMRS